MTSTTQLVSTSYSKLHIKNYEEIQVLGRSILNQRPELLHYNLAAMLEGKKVVFQSATPLPEPNTEYTVLFVDESRGPQVITTQGINLIDAIPV